MLNMLGIDDNVFKGEYSYYNGKRYYIAQAACGNWRVFCRDDNEYFLFVSVIMARLMSVCDAMNSITTQSL